MHSTMLSIVSLVALAAFLPDHVAAQIERISVGATARGGSMMRRETGEVKAHSELSEEPEELVHDADEKHPAKAGERHHQKIGGEQAHKDHAHTHKQHAKQGSQLPSKKQDSQLLSQKKEGLQEDAHPIKHKQADKHKKASKNAKHESKVANAADKQPAGKGSVAIDSKAASSVTKAASATHPGALVQEDHTDAKAAAAVEEVASDFASLGLTNSEIDPDKNYHAHKKDAFQVKVTGPSGSEVCLSEVHHGYAVRAVKCSGAHGQHWYWNGEHLQNLKSDERCLGYANLVSETGSEGHQLAMYPCSGEDDASMYTAWKMDEHGRLQSKDTTHCMAFNEEGGHMNAITLPCDE